MRLRGWLWHIMQPLFKGRTCLQKWASNHVSRLSSPMSELSGQPPRLFVFPRKLPLLPWGMQNSCGHPECEVVSHLHRRSIPLKLSSASVLAGCRLMRSGVEHETEKETSDPLPTCPDNLVADPVGRQQGRNCNLGTRCVRAGPVERRQSHN